jgi:hypothetical protein
VSSRTRPRLLGVGGQLPVDDVGQSSLEAAQGFHWGLAGGGLAPVVAAAGVRFIGDAADPEQRLTTADLRGLMVLAD